MILSRRLAIVSGAGALLLAASEAHAARTPTRALIIGQKYGDAHPFSPLETPMADARLIADTLRPMVNAVFGPVEPADAAAFWREVRAFGDNLRPSQAAIFYFAGHGLQAEGRNYLLSNDGKELLSVDEIVAYLRERCAGLVVILDACRDNPAAAGELPIGSMPVRSAKGARAAAARLTQQAGLAQMTTQGKGVLFVYSTAWGKTAADRLGPTESNSPFAAALAAALPQKRSLEEIMIEVAAEVDRRTNGDQNPWRQGGLDRLIFLAGEPNDWLKKGSKTAPIMPPP